MLNSLKIGHKLLILTAVSLATSIVVAIVSIAGMTEVRTNLETSYNHANKPIQSLARSHGSVGDIVEHMLLAFQHEPNSQLAQTHGDQIEDHFEKIHNLSEHLEKNWASFSATSLGIQEKVLVKNFNDHYAPSKNTTDQTIAALRTGDFSEKNLARFLAAVAAHTPQMDETTNALIDVAEKIAYEAFTDGEDSIGTMRITIIATFATGMVACVALALFLIKSITRPLSGVQLAMTEIEASRDFTRRVPVASKDEVGQAALAFNLLLTSLQEAFKNILAHVDRLTGITEELTEHASGVAQNSTAASESTSAMAAAVEEMSVSITHVSDNAKDTLNVSKHTGDLSQQGSNVIRDTVTRMREMAQSVESSSATIAELGKQSEQISSIVQVIKDVADQTNLLALNAAIEAARAGEQGRGFAVVADEVRKLAERTSAATGEIASMISAIQESSHSAVRAMSHAAEQVEQSVNLADRAGSAIADIQQGAEIVRNHVNDITSALTEQGIASQSIAQQVERVARAAEENSVKAHHAAGALEKIKAMAQGVRTAIGQFTL
ncbi:MAG: methyl-accepting chemotaxis protein [Azoarcus sp.]|jgi:methyl-accepting chemotaxis protein|nr:methyl-accepting chemotaxis protein [Azoarcus sp.]